MNLGKYNIKQDRHEWYVFVPLTDPLRDIDSAGFIVAPAGESWWPTYEEACDFVCQVEQIRISTGSVHGNHE